MGSDRESLFSRRKAKTAEKLQRRKAIRRRYDKVLIVCEGEKTEPLYFNELKDHYELDTADVKVSGDCGSDPISVVNHGKKLYQQEIDNREEPFDRVFCVFDKDQHSTYEDALSKISAMKPYGIFTAVTSVPCFEIWVLMHFNYSTAPFTSSGKKSSGTRALEEVKKYWPNYSKGKGGSFQYLLEHIGRAEANSKNLITYAEQNKTDNPTTMIHTLVSYLQNLKA